MSNPPISIIIPAKDAALTIRKCLSAVLDQADCSFGKDYEVIVVDDGSEDNTAVIAHDYGGCKLISQNNAGPASARNTGASCAAGELLVFTDADCAPARNWLIQLIKPFENPEVIGVRGAYITDEKGLIPRFVQMEYDYKYSRIKDHQNIDFVDTYSAAYREHIFRENGGFDEALMKLEDQEFSYRLASLGHRLVFQSNARVRHPHDKHIWEYVSRKFLIGYWKAVIIRWMPGKTLEDSHTPATQRWQVGLLAALIINTTLLFVCPSGVWLMLISAFGFLISSAPFIQYAARHDKQISMIAFPMLLIRALSQGLGLLLGFIHNPIKGARFQ